MASRPEPTLLPKLSQLYRVIPDERGYIVCLAETIVRCGTGLFNFVDCDITRWVRGRWEAGGYSVNDEDRRILELCELTSKEQDTEKLLQLVAELNEILERKEQRLLAQRKPSTSKSAD